MGKKKIIFIIILVVIIGLIVATFLIKNNLPKASEITVVPTMNDKISGDSSWCGSLQLAWNEMKNEIVGKDIEVSPQIEMVENLNKEDFNTSMLSDDYYYIAHGPQTLELKEKIEKGIDEKFNSGNNTINDNDDVSQASSSHEPNNFFLPLILDQENEEDEEEIHEKVKSDILNRFDWDNPDKCFIYSMLYREFKYLKKFDKLASGKFGKSFENIEYFGIDKETDDFVGKQIEVLYYNSKNDFAVSINTKSNDEVIFCKNPKGNTFKKIYENMQSKAKKYKGYTSFKGIDELKVPYLNLDIETEFE